MSEGHPAGTRGLHYLLHKCRPVKQRLQAFADKVFVPSFIGTRPQGQEQAKAEER